MSVLPGIGVILAPGIDNSITWLGAGAGAAEAPLSGTLQVPYPAGMANGNFMFLLIYALSGVATPVVTTPAGWTSIASTTGADTLSKIHGFWKSATGSESGNLDVTLTNGDVVAGGRIEFYNKGSGVEAASAAMSDATATTINAIAVTTTGNNKRAVQGEGVSNNTTFTSISGETGADYTKNMAEFSSGSGLVSLCNQSAPVPVATAISGGSSTLGATSTYRGRIGFAILP